MRTAILMNAKKPYYLMRQGGKKPSQQRILCLILDYIMDQTRVKSQIMQHVGLTSTQTKDYLGYLVGKD